MKYLAILPFLFMAFNAYADVSADIAAAKADKCVTIDEVKTIDPQLGSIAIRELTKEEIALGNDMIDGDMDGPNDDLKVYASFFPKDVGIVKLVVFSKDGCAIGEAVIPDVIAAMFINMKFAE